MIPGDSAPSLRRALIALSEAENDLMAVKRGSTVREAERLDRAIAGIREAQAEARAVRDAREGLRW